MRGKPGMFGPLRKAAAVAAAFVAVVAIAACGSDGDDGSTSAASTTGAASTTASRDFAGTELVLGGWGGTYNEATKEFYGDGWEADGGGSITFVDASGAQAARVEAQNQADDIQWDMIDSASSADAYTLWDKGYLEQMPADLKADLTEILGARNVSDFGITMGSLAYVIACNMDEMDSCPQDMAEFFDVERFPQDRILPGIDPVALASLAQEANGTPADEVSTTPLDLDAAIATLERVKPHTKVFWESGEQQTQAIRTGEAPMGILWSGRAYQMLGDGVNLEINWNEGSASNGWMVVLKGAPNVEASWDFVRWIAENPKAQAGWAEAVDYSVPSPKALDFMPPEQADSMVGNPKNLEQTSSPNWEWYVENAEELNRRFQDFLRG